MILDSKLVLCDNLDINGVATTETISDNVFQLDAVKRFLINNSAGNPIIPGDALNDMGRAGRIVLKVSVGDTGWYCTGGTGTVDIRLYEHTTETVTSGSVVLHVNIPGVVITAPATKLEAGKHLFSLIVPLDVWGDTTNYFVGLAAIANTQTLTAGTLNAWLEAI